MRTVVMRVSASPWLSWPGAGGASSRAELGVVDVFGDGRVLAADGACGVLLQPDLAELGRERVEEQQPADQRLADPEQQLDRLARLQRADDAGQHAEHAALRAARCELGRR